MQQTQALEIQDQDQEDLKLMSSAILSIESNSINCTVQKDTSAVKKILFLGFKHSTFDKIYGDYDFKKCLQENEFFKIVFIKKNEKKSCLLINSPYSLKRCTNQDSKIKLLTSKINLEQILDTSDNLKVSIALNFDKLEGETDLQKFQYIQNENLLQFGKIRFKEERLSIFRAFHDNMCTYWFLNTLPSNFTEGVPCVLRGFLKLIFTVNKLHKIKIERNPNLFLYGQMSREMKKDQDKLLIITNRKIDKFQKQLLYLQQIPILDECYDLQKSLAEYLQQLNNILRVYSKPKLQDVWKIFYKINNINVNFVETINTELKKLNISRLEKFLEINNLLFVNLFIQKELLNAFQLKQVNDFFTKYNNYLYNDTTVASIENFAITLDFWNKYFNQFFINKLFHLRMVARDIQPIPEQEFETGVFFFGKSRVGKSTIVNLIQDPQSLSIKKEIDKQCYVIKEGFETQFKIDHGSMSETQIVSGKEINGVWYFDCPGFDDNISEYKRIAHRINLYNYLKKTKKVIGFLVVDGSIKDAQTIKDTINPLYELMEDKNQLLREHKKWLSLILVKIKKNTRTDNIQFWTQSYRGQLEGYYSIYQQMYENNNQCVEFYRAKKKYLKDNQQFELLKNDTKQKITDIVQKQLENNEFQVKFQLKMEQRIFFEIKEGIQMLFIKVEHILQHLQSLLNDYILENVAKVSKKQVVLRQLCQILKENINEGNLKEFIKTLYVWCDGDDEDDNVEIHFVNLKQLISDAKVYMIILLNVNDAKLSPLKLSTEIIRKNAEIAIKVIDKILHFEIAIDNPAAIVVLTLIFPELQVIVGLELLIRCISGLVVTYRSEEGRNLILREKYKAHLKKQENDELI